MPEEEEDQEAPEVQEAQELIPEGFYDPDGGGAVQVRLRQMPQQDFCLLRSIGYRDPEYASPFLVPAPDTNFRTDLTSVPTVFLWLVPTVGTHLPAALLHDALVYDEDEPKTYQGPDTTPEEADRIFRDAMSGLGVARIRRWLIWTGVTIFTAFTRLEPHRRWQAVVVFTLGIVVVLGIVATLDLLDIWDVLPWMGERSTGAELIGGAIFAVLIPALLSILWGRLWRAGLIAGVALALLLHITIAVAIVLVVYMAAEWVISRPEQMGPGVRTNLGVPVDDRECF